ncbi:MAG: pyridoxal kinase [Pseudomonadota bacterium]
MSEATGKQAIVSISSHVVRGSVGNRGIVFALQQLGFPVWAIPTTILPWHPGHGSTTGIVPDAKQYESIFSQLAQAPWKDEVSAVLSGYIAHTDQVLRIRELVLSFREEKEDLIYTCDPVIGDVGGLYIPHEIAIAIKENLLPLCDIITPNLFELAWLTGCELPSTAAEARDMASSLEVPTVLVTSVPGAEEAQIANMVVTKEHCTVAFHQKLSTPPNGTGDVTAALFLANRLKGLKDAENLINTTAVIFEILRYSAHHNSDELKLEGVDLAPNLPAANIELLEL